jgi:hypothetical protein
MTKETQPRVTSKSQIPNPNELQLQLKWKRIREATAHASRGEIPNFELRIPATLSNTNSNRRIVCALEFGFEFIGSWKLVIGIFKRACRFVLTFPSPLPEAP